MKSRVIELKQGDTCKIDCGTHGENITGPAYIVVLQDEAAVGAATSIDEETLKLQQGITKQKLIKKGFDPGGFQEMN